MTVTYGTCGRPTRRRIAHILDWRTGDRPGGGIARWLCGTTGQQPVTPVDPTDYKLCENCDGAALGPVVYRYFAADGSCLYIGSTQNISVRVSGHRSQRRARHG